MTQQATSWQKSTADHSQEANRDPGTQRQSGRGQSKEGKAANRREKVTTLGEDKIFKIKQEAYKKQTDSW